jgi:DNA polymerase-3 subunit delta
MALRPGELQGHLAKTLAPAYAVHGDEALLALEAADAVRAAARRHGYAEREVFEPGRHFDWSEFAHAGASRSLFGARKILELRLPTGKPGAQGAQAIADYCEHPGEEAVLLVTLPRLDRATQASGWFGALSRAGVVIDVYPVERERLPAWIAERLARQKQSASREVLEFLAERVEGNLLAAQQEVLKLGLLAPEGALELETVHSAVAAVARYDPYAAAEALVARDTARYVRVIDGLRGEGEQPTFVLFVIASALFVLQGIAQGGRAEALFPQHRLFARPLQRAVQAAAGRFAPQAIERALAQAAALDRAIKGVGAGDPWTGFLELGLALHRPAPG